MSALVLRTFLAFFAARLGVEALLLRLNLREVRAKGGEVPGPLRGTIPEEVAVRSRDYAIQRGRFGLVALLWDGGVTLALLLSGALPLLDRVLAAAGLTEPSRFAAFLVSLAAAGGVAALPLSLYGTFVLEARFGFNRTTLRTWLADQAKAVALGLALGVPLLYAAYFFMSATGDRWWIWLTGFLAAVQALLLWLYPALIAPLFNRFTPLPDGEIRTRLEALCRATGFRTRGLFAMDASRRSSHSNAYFVGVLRPRIVLFDTLLSSLSLDEAVAVLAHEIGHFRLHHVLKRLATGFASTALALWVLSRLVGWQPFFQAFGFPSASWQAAVALFALAGGSFTFFLAPLSAWISRRHEYAADRYAVAHASAAGLASALVKLNRENLANLHPHPWYAAWHLSHPTLLDRLRAIGDARPS
ncbi:MAG TPA: M48 family metallopeptidase [Anaeromyxobacteraceae bacterium]|nr:M48 family metallopeptidase [Anaeromyxobacteraceae bacterium]